MNDKSNVRSYKNVGGNQEGYIAVTGGNIWYKVVGKNKKGIPVLVLHGGPGASYDYLEPLTELADERPFVSMINLAAVIPTSLITHLSGQ